jgi:hypothetical protein
MGCSPSFKDQDPSQLLEVTLRRRKAKTYLNQRYADVLQGG